MKNTIKRVLSVMMAMMMVLTAIPLSRVNSSEIFAVKASAKNITSYNDGSTVSFGSYPQSRVTDSATISALKNLTPDWANWTSYRYYKGSGNQGDGEMKPADYMRYCDISYNGNKYRAVKFTSYRPYLTGFALDNNKEHTYQDDNGYAPGTVYYFRFEPLNWVVIESYSGFVACEKAIDSQAFNNFILYYNNNNGSSGDDYYSDSARKNLASDWSKSDLREWLNKDFYNTAFTADEKSKINDSVLGNSYYNMPSYHLDNTTDKIFVVSHPEWLRFPNSSKVRKPTDYALCQGCRTNSDGTVSWIIRTSNYPGYIGEIKGASIYAFCDHDNSTFLGTVPAFRFKLDAVIDGVVLGDVNGDGSINSSDALLALQHSVGKATLTGDKFTCADVTKDNKINSSDALKILQYSVGQISKF